MREKERDRHTHTDLNGTTVTLNSYSAPNLTFTKHCDTQHRFSTFHFHALISRRPHISIGTVGAVLFVVTNGIGGGPRSVAIPLWLRPTPASPSAPPSQVRWLVVHQACASVLCLKNGRVKETFSHASKCPDNISGVITLFTGVLPCNKKCIII